MRDPELRPRVLQHVAKRRGISTGDAQRYIEGSLYRELGVTPALGSNPTLGQVVDHLDNPHLDGPSSGPSKGLQLDASAKALFGDNKLLDRTLKAISLEKGISYVAALEKLTRAFDYAPRGTVRELFQRAGVNEPGDVAEDVKLLSRADAEASASYEQETRNLARECTNPRGMLLIDQGADVGGMIGDPAEFERRFFRARSAAPGMYEAGDDGRESFREQDRLHLDAGLDLVRTLERSGELQAAGNRRVQVRRQLEQSLTGSRDQRARVRLLDAEIAKLRGQRDRLIPSTSREPQRDSLRTLDRGANDPSPSLHPDLQMRIIMERRRELDEPYDVAREKVLAEAHDVGAPLTLDDDPDSARFVSRPGAAQAPADTTPTDVEPGWRSMGERVSARLVQLGRPESDYQRTLEELIVEDRDAAGGVIRGPLYPVTDPGPRP